MRVASCGFGKSVVIKEICDSAVSKGNNYMILVHRIELVNQLQERNLKANMVQTISRHIEEPPKEMLVIWDYEHKKYIEEIEELKYKMSLFNR